MDYPSHWLSNQRAGKRVRSIKGRAQKAPRRRVLQVQRKAPLEPNGSKVSGGQVSLAYPYLLDPTYLHGCGCSMTWRGRTRLGIQRPSGVCSSKIGSALPNFASGATCAMMKCAAIPLDCDHRRAPAGAFGTCPAMHIRPSPVALLSATELPITHPSGHVALSLSGNCDRELQDTRRLQPASLHCLSNRKCQIYPAGRERTSRFACRQDGRGPLEPLGLQGPLIPAPDARIYI